MKTLNTQIKKLKIDPVLKKSRAEKNSKLFKNAA